MGHIQCLTVPQWAWALPFFISKLEFSYDKYSVDEVSTKIYRHFYFGGITLGSICVLCLEFSHIHVRRMLLTQVWVKTSVIHVSMFFSLGKCSSCSVFE